MGGAPGLTGAGSGRSRGADAGGTRPVSLKEVTNSSASNASKLLRERPGTSISSTTMAAQQSSGSCKLSQARDHHERGGGDSSSSASLSSSLQSAMRVYRALLEHPFFCAQRDCSSRLVDRISSLWAFRPALTIRTSSVRSELSSLCEFLSGHRVVRSGSIAIPCIRDIYRHVQKLSPHGANFW